MCQAIEEFALHDTPSLMGLRTKIEATLQHLLDGMQVAAQRVDSNVESYLSSEASAGTCNLQSDILASNLRVDTMNLQAAVSALSSAAADASTLSVVAEASSRVLEVVKHLSDGVQRMVMRLEASQVLREADAVKMSMVMKDLAALEWMREVSPQGVNAILAE
eukprot:6468039-Amphidinium_carterae.2